MPPELLALALSGLLLAAQLAVMAVRANLEIGTHYFLSPRDDPPPRSLDRITARLQRAYNNQLEALLLFAVAVTVVTLADKTSPLTAACAWVFLGARILFVPAYAFGWVPWRSVFFGLGLVSSLIILLVALLG